MINLQLFAEGEGNDNGAGNGDDGGAGAGSGDGGNEMSFDDFLGQAENRAEFDRRVQKAINTAVTKAQSARERMIFLTKEEQQNAARP